MLVAATLLVAFRDSIANAAIRKVLQITARRLVEAVADGVVVVIEVALEGLVGVVDLGVDEGKTKVIVIIPMTT